jgi:hypothetical protein
MEIQRNLPKSSCGLPHKLSVPATQDINVNPLTELCLSIAALMPGQLDAIADIVNDYRRLFGSVAATRERQSRPDGDTDLPLISIGPSGIGGRFQREIDL